MESEVLKMIKQSFESLPILDVKNVVGEPIEVGQNCKVFPLVKISIGTVGGGADNFVKKKSKKSPFVGASTSGISAEPLGFLVVRKNGQQIITLESHDAFFEVSKTMAEGISYFIKKSGKAKLKEKEIFKNAKK